MVAPAFLNPSSFALSENSKKSSFFTMVHVHLPAQLNHKIIFISAEATMFLFRIAPRSVAESGSECFFSDDEISCVPLRELDFYLPPANF